MNKPRAAFLLPVYFGSNHSLFLGVGYLSASLQRAGYETRIIDEDAVAWVMRRSGIQNYLVAARTRVVQELLCFLPDILCFSINTANYRNALNLLQDLRTRFPDCFCVVGGPHISTSFDAFHRHHSDLYDAAIIGEGESALRDLCRWYERGRPQEIIPGVRFSNRPDKFCPRNMETIDALPLPDRDGFFQIYTADEMDMAKENYNRVFYASLPGFHNGHARVVASRGCYNQCSFCSPSVYWRNPVTGTPCRRIRDPAQIVDEIAMLISRGVRAVYFDDPTFPVKSNPSFFSAFEREITERRLHFSWGAPVCASELDEKLLERLRKIGFRYTYFGLESYRPENLSDMGKRQDILNCLTLLRQCREYDIHCDASYQIGLPGEDMEEIRRSIDWLFAQGLERNTFCSITAVWPETELAHRYGITSDAYEPDYPEYAVMRDRGLYFYEQGNEIIEQFYSNCSGTYHFIPMETAIEAKYYFFDKGLRNRFL